MSQSYFLNQAVRNMAPILSEDNRLELIASITAFLWIFAGIFSDGILLLASLVTTIVISIYLVLLSVVSNSYHYDIHTIAFRRSMFATLAHWAYTTGGSQGPSSIQLDTITIPVLQISQFTVGGLIVIWFASKYADQIRDPNVPTRIYPFLVFRGVLRGILLAGLIYALFWSDPIDTALQVPWLVIVYLIEPFIYGISQIFNPTVSRFELTLGNARLPSVALRESFLTNTFMLIITMLFDGVEGGIWQLIRTFYIIGTIIVFIYSIDAIKKFKEQPLGKQAISDFFGQTPEKLEQIRLEDRLGHVITSETAMKLSNHSSINLEEGSILIPVEEIKGKMSAVIIGRGETVLDTGTQQIGEQLEGVSSVLLPKKEFKQISSTFLATRLDQVDLKELNLPSLQELQQYVNLLSSNMGNFVNRVVNQMNSIDLSNYGIREEKGVTDVHLPGIRVNETPDLTSVSVAGLRVLDGHKATTVRFGSTLTVVDLPKASFVSLPGITVLDVVGMGSAVNILGFKISEGIPAEKLDEFRRIITQQLDRWELGIDAELGRFLADKSATSLLNVGWDGKFNMLLDSSKKTMGTHQALQLPGLHSEKMRYLPPNFDEIMRDQSKEDVEFIELTGMDPVSSEFHPSKERTPELDSSKAVSSDSSRAKFDSIIDVEIDLDDEEDED